MSQANWDSTRSSLNIGGSSPSVRLRWRIRSQPRDGLPGKGVGALGESATRTAIPATIAAPAARRSVSRARARRTRSRCRRSATTRHPRTAERARRGIGLSIGPVAVLVPAELTDPPPAHGVGSPGTLRGTDDGHPSPARRASTGFGSRSGRTAPPPRSKDGRFPAGGAACTQARVRDAPRRPEARRGATSRRGGRPGLRALERRPGPPPTTMGEDPVDRHAAPGCRNSHASTALGQARPWHEQTRRKMHHNNSSCATETRSVQICL